MNNSFHDYIQKIRINIRIKKRDIKKDRGGIKKFNNLSYLSVYILSYINK